MTAPLPPLQWPLQIAIVGFSEKEMDQLKKWAHDYAKLAVREALERAALYLLNDCHDDMLREEEAAGIRAMIEEYK